ncbi:MAG: hypothetical protein JNJ73_10320 [Hyphomonadaceae bacterium]|nr:hypothetical protein [Hyphomonadaceae bacterium]
MALEPRRADAIPAADAGILPAQAPVDWSAIIAGAALATAIALVLLGFGAAMGLSAASPYEGEGIDARLFAIAAGLWLVWVQLVSFGAGGYLSARLRRVTRPTSEHDVEMRDGVHGLLVWAIGVIAAAFIAFAGIGGVTNAPERSLTEEIASAASDVVSERSENDITPAATPAEDATSRAADAAEATPAEEDQVEAARRTAIIAAFITAAALLIGAVAAFFGAGKGGEHRDRNLVLPLFARLR